MKKILIPILIILFVFSGFYYATNQALTVEGIDSVEIVNSNRSITDQADLLKFMPFLSKNNNILSEASPFNNPYDLIYKLEDEETIDVSFHHDFENRKIDYKINENEFYSLSKEDSYYFFNDPSFKEIYKKFEPKVNFTYNNKLLPWNQRDFSINYLLAEENDINYIWHQEETFPPHLIEDPSRLEISSSNHLVKLLVYDKDELIYSQNDENNNPLFIPDYDGVFKYHFEVKSKGNSLTSFNKMVEYQIEIDREPIFTLNKATIDQGDSLIVNSQYVNSDDLMTIESPLVSDLKFYKNEKEVVAYIPIHARTKPGIYDITIANESKSKNVYSLEVIKSDFKTQYLHVSESTMASTSNAKAYAEYNNYFHPVRKVSSDEKYYDENFMMPLKARISTEFGEGRYINDTVTSYSHSGLDLAAPLGTSIQSINHGVITLSRHFALTGNTIIIDHGQGLLSYYLHLDTLNVALGDKVQRGDVIGTVGSTGRSTGPHLHFGMSFYTTYIEPGYFIFNQPITKENYKELFN